MLRLYLPLILLVGCLPTQAAAQPAKPEPVDEAVNRALAFLQKMQEPDGAWSVATSKHPAVTSLAVMAFLSAGHVPGEGPYGPTVDKAVRWVLTTQRPNGIFSGPGAVGQDMYQQGICTLMLAEVAGMTDARLGRQIKAALEKAVPVILKAQRKQGNDRGGWRYQVEGTDADLSVTGWQLLALRAARNLGCDVPAERIDQAVAYVLRCRHPGTGAFCYTAGGAQTTACTGTGILCMELCGKQRHRTPEALKAGSVLLKAPPSWSDTHFCYGIYYCSQAMFQLGNNYWSFYRPQLHKLLLDRQQANGSWLINDGFGPSYATSMCVLALTVEYRLLPIYQRGEDEPTSRDREGAVGR